MAWIQWVRHADLEADRLWIERVQVCSLGVMKNEEKESWGGKGYHIVVYH